MNELPRCQRCDCLFFGAPGDLLCVECGPDQSRAADAPETVAALLAENARLREVLREVEWKGKMGECPECWAIPSEGHAHDCRLAAALSSAATGGEGEG
jgi:hypothetical protein